MKQLYFRKVPVHYFESPFEDRTKFPESDRTEFPEPAVPISSRWKPVGPDIKTPWPDPEGDERLVHAVNVIIDALLRVRNGSPCMRQFEQLILEADRVSRRQGKLVGVRPPIDICAIARELAEDESGFFGDYGKTQTLGLLCVALRRSRQIRKDHLQRVRSGQDRSTERDVLEPLDADQSDSAWRHSEDESRKRDWRALLDEVVEVLQRQATAISALCRAVE